MDIIQELLYNFSIYCVLANIRYRIKNRTIIGMIVDKFSRDNYFPISILCFFMQDDSCIV